MKLKDFYYELPQELIAQRPLTERTASKLLVLDRNTNKIYHRSFRNFADYLKKGDLLILNNSRVIPARLYGIKEDTKAKIEFLLLKRLDMTHWEVILKPGRRAGEKTRFLFGDGLLRAEIIKIIDDGKRIVKFTYDGVFENILNKLGKMPLPPYIKEELADKERYQTVYAEPAGSAAAPTAGLHFTEEYLKEIRDRGINIGFVTLHVGLGTFRQVKSENICEHHMHSEHFIIEADTAELINETKKKGGAVIAAGTTSVRVLESAADSMGNVCACEGDTDIFIYPGYKFKAVNHMLTNFHLPESTLLMLISAFSDRETILRAYREAIEHRYRFFSFGDAMYII